ncbi:MAG: hypothetical protein ACI4U6_00290 [Acutalibacteraceae bacterium]
MQKALYFIRKITTPPILATAFLLVLYFIQPYVFRSVWQLICGILFLGVLPILGYPLQKYIPYFKDKGREGQRILAMIFSVAGYLLGIITVAFAKASAELYVIYLEYLLSGIVILLLNKIFHFKASGHACGILGPVALLCYFGLYIEALCGLLITVLVYFSSLKTKRHTLPQLIGGSIVPIVVIAVLKLIFG